MTGPLTGLLEKRALRRWTQVMHAVDDMDPASLKVVRTRARALNRRLERVLHVADGRLALPFGEQAAIRRPMHADWAWRPELWCGPIKPAGMASVASKTAIGREVKVFHDCTRSELSIRQTRNTQTEDIAPYGVRMDVFRFEGSFLSLVLEIPKDGLDQLSCRHVVRLDIRVETERPLEIFGRLNVRHGPNVEQLVREFDGSSGEFSIEFDLGATQMNEARVERAWVDLIFEEPSMNEVALRDVTLTRRPRAEF